MIHGHICNREDVVICIRVYGLLCVRRCLFINLHSCLWLICDNIIKATFVLSEESTIFWNQQYFLINFSLRVNSYYQISTLTIFQLEIFISRIGIDMNCIISEVDQSHFGDRLQLYYNILNVLPCLY